jgi:hypothetical protein
MSLLPVFTVATLLAIVPIALVGVVGSWAMVAVAVAMVVAFAAGLVALLGRMIEDGH